MAPDFPESSAVGRPTGRKSRFVPPWCGGGVGSIPPRVPLPGGTHPGRAIRPSAIDVPWLRGPACIPGEPVPDGSIRDPHQIEIGPNSNWQGASTGRGYYLASLCRSRGYYPECSAFPGAGINFHSRNNPAPYLWHGWRMHPAIARRGFVSRWRFESILPLPEG